MKMTHIRSTIKFVTNITILLALGVVMSGCSTGRSITIGSEPPGARVLADGRDIGETPITISQDEVFPPRMVNWSTYMVKGNLILEKQGCEQVLMPVDDNVLSNDINVTLKCDPNAVVSVPMKTWTTEKTVAPEMKNSNDNTQRLEELKRLYDKGVISDAEYQEHRKRILDSI